MPVNKKSRARKAAWIAFGIIALVVTSSTAQENHVEDYAMSNRPEPEVPSAGRKVEAGVDRSLEAERAYNKALATLSEIIALPQVHAEETDPALGTGSSSIFSLFSPNIQGHGPWASALRIAVKLRHRSWIPSIVSSMFRYANGTRQDEETHVNAAKVTLLLQHASSLGNLDALFTLATISIFPPTRHFPSDPQTAFDSLSRHAAATGNSSSQALLGFFYSTGYHGVVSIDQAKAQIYYTFAASGGHRGAQMALGYRYWTGIGVLEDCNRAVGWYERAADQAMQAFSFGPPGGRTIPPISARLSDLVGGLYGPGASVASTGLNSQRPAIKAANSRAAGETWQDVLEYYLFNADRGELDFAYRLGKIFYQGSLYATPGGIASGGEGVGTIPQDYVRARYYFLYITRQVWPRDPPDYRHHPLQNKEEAASVGYAAVSAAYIGRMYLRGEGVKADPLIAKMWFDRGAEYGDRECHNGLGIIWRDGLIDAKRDILKALHHFSAAAVQELAEAQVNLGKYYYGRGEFKLAIAHLENAIRSGSPFEAYYYLAKIQIRFMKNSDLPEHITASACAVAVSFNKLVAERGVWDVDQLKIAEHHWNVGTDRHRQIAMLQWWIAAERGSEIAQNNLAFILDQDKSILRFTRFSTTSASTDSARLALTQWIRSATQNNIDALVKVGDYFYHGLGASDEPELLRWEKAAGYYQSAADTQVSALAMWNLGWMYENGIGVAQDFHLAKRHYDLALETNSEAYLPVKLSLIKLCVRRFWHTRILRDYSATPPTSESDSNPSIDRGPAEVEHEPARRREETHDDYDDSWLLGKAKEEFRKRHQQPDGSQVGRDEDAVQWARERRNNVDRDSDFGPEDYFDGAIRGGNRGPEEVDEFAETMLLVVLCLLVSVLFYLRGRWVERLRREREEQQQGAQAQAPAPPPGDGGPLRAPGEWPAPL